MHGASLLLGFFVGGENAAITDPRAFAEYQ